MPEQPVVADAQAQEQAQAQEKAQAQAPVPDAAWQELAGLDPATAQFPAQARVGNDRILVLRIGEGFRGVERSCPHQQKSLHDAFLQGGDRMIRCRWHNYVFRLADGKGINCPGYKLRVFDVKLENGALYARAV
jgi:nitrite reductase/ring-hydroxylating ferredoxin subunit